jgi:hypothetical protein
VEQSRQAWRRVTRDLIPTVIVFFGPAPEYVGLALRSAESRGNHVVMIGDASNRDCWKRHVDADALASEKYDRFTRVFVRMSNYPDGYEQAFWRRPFAIEAWMREAGVDKAFILDADVMTFANYADEVLPRIAAQHDAALMTLVEQDEYDWATSLHFSYWTLGALSSFTSFCIDTYGDPTRRDALQRKWAHDRETSTAGGVCEMTLLHLWRATRPDRVMNFAAGPDAVGDLAVGTPDNVRRNEYEMRGGFKQLAFTHSRAYGRRTTGEYARFWCIHCQGEAKTAMRWLSAPLLRSHFGRLAAARVRAATAAGTIAGLLSEAAERLAEML